MTQPPGSITVLRERYGDRYRWLLLLSVMVGTMASIMSSTIVNVAIPDMSHYFMLGQERAQWVTSGFMVATTVSMLTTPWLLSRYGYRATYVGAMVLLLAGGIAGGLSGHFGLVLAARVAEGLAAGVVQPIPAVIILYAFKPTSRDAPAAFSGWGWCWLPLSDPAWAGCWSTGLAGDPSSSWSCRFALHRLPWPISSYPLPHPVACLRIAGVSHWTGAA